MNFPLLIFKVSGHSMEPTLKSGQFVLVYRWATPKVGDIVVASDPQRNILILKRVVKIRHLTSDVRYQIIGDNPGHFRPKWINKSEIVGKVIGFRLPVLLYLGALLAYRCVL